MNCLKLKLVLFLLSLIEMSQVGYGQDLGMAPTPSTGGPSNDGTTIDQGIAYVLLFAALVITYLVH
ncbi:hypothetical protein AMTRI_Chr05g64910 [Amborella trichopoda]